MEELKRHISEFLAFVKEPPNEEKYLVLEMHLAITYRDGLNLSNIVEPSTEDPESIEYNTLRNVLEQNFPELGFYHKVLNIHEISEEPELATGDALDDLTDIVKDLKEVMSLTDDNTFLWQLHFNFNSHFKEHLVNLINYLHELKR